MLFDSGMVCEVAEQVFDRENAVEYSGILAAEYGVVNPDTSYGAIVCDRSPVPKPCYAAPGAVLCRGFRNDRLDRRGARL
jgi:hypothetical protein